VKGDSLKGERRAVERKENGYVSIFRRLVGGDVRFQRVSLISVNLSNLQVRPE